jgi:phospholipid transport system substrate-binding protein
MTYRRTAAACAALFWLMAAAAWAAGPLETLKAPLEESLSILRDPQYQAADRKAEQREKIWVLIDATFDFEEISKRALGRNWRLLDEAQQREFVDLFTKLLGNTYLDQVQEAYKDEEVVFDGEEIHDTKPLARVKARILSSKGDIPVDYSLLGGDGAWRVYDIKVEGVSLVKNYRTQFDEILLKESPDELIERLREKVAEQEAARNG